MVMRRFAALLLVFLLSGCSALQGTPQQRMGTISALVRGSPDDAESAIKAQAVAAKADYYVIIMIDETIITGQWYSQAILYRK